ncbi:MAG: hypothetical protein EXX96DRAFT_5281 [Benjaminiella poitrasii]|nr:MAG: hypothetical protein EXX96DRAFT_5281 [Benjaminiella poitrasii]
MIVLVQYVRILFFKLKPLLGCICIEFSSFGFNCLFIPRLFQQSSQSLLLIMNILFRLYLLCSLQNKCAHFYKR